MTISVIIPVYNSEQYIDKCLFSLLNQSFQDFEIVVVDDGSTDTSRQKAEYILAGRNNCTIVSRENGGAAAARNSGIQLATGDLVTFIDSDDYLASDYLERMVEAFSKCDMLISGIIFMKGYAEKHRLLPPEDELTIADLRNNKAIYLDYTISPFGKMFRKEIIDRYKLSFDETMPTAEDRDFNIEYISKAQRIRFIHYAGYFYQTDNQSSLTKLHSNGRLRRSILYWNKIYRLLEGTNDTYLAHRLYFFLTDIISDHLQRKDFLGAFHALREVRPLFDRSFLRRNLKDIQAPNWQKALVRIYLG